MLVASCGKSPQTIPSNDLPAAQQQARRYVQSLVHPGESSEEVKKQFGNPIKEYETQTHQRCLTYLFSDDNQAAKNAYVAGFEVFFVSNRVDSCEPIFQYHR